MLAIGQGVDHRHRGVGGQADDVGMQKDARHDHVDVAAEDAGSVDDAFALAELDLGGRQVDGVAAEFEHRDFERHAVRSDGF